MKRIQTYWIVWSKIAQYGIAFTFINRGTITLLLAGKAVRFGMLLFFLLLIEKNIPNFAGYTTDQVLIFFLTYQFLDTVTQIFYRGVYRFSWQVRSGELDFYLSKPISPLFRILTGEPDILDMIFLVPTTILSIWIAMHLHLTFTLGAFLLYAVLVVNGFLIATGIHILVICLGILTTEVDNAIMLYRDINTLARFPVNIYKEPFRTLLFFIVPVGFMNTIPAQVLLHLQPSYAVPIAFAAGIGFFALSLGIWKISLKKYTSAGG